MKYSLLNFTRVKIPNLNVTDLGYYGNSWRGELEPLIILCCYNWWTRVLELVTGEQLQGWTNLVSGTTSRRTDSLSGTISRVKRLGIWNYFKVKRPGIRNYFKGEKTRYQELSLDKVSDLQGQKSNWNWRSGPDLSRGVGPSGLEVKLELKKWPVLHGIALLK